MIVNDPGLLGSKPRSDDIGLIYSGNAWVG